jgi:hypothetical protein
MYQVGASGLFNVVSVTSWGHFLDATASRAYEQVGDDHAPGWWQERAAALAEPSRVRRGRRPSHTAGIMARRGA